MAVVPTNEETRASSGPLAGIRVVEFGNYIAAPTAGRLLAEFGAEVVKVERPGVGDEVRAWRMHGAGTSLLFRLLGRNKKSVTIDLHSTRGQQVARALTDSADVVLENFRPGTLENWGLGPDRLRETNPGLVVVRISGFGQTGPYSHRAGFGGVAEAMAGLRHVTGNPGERPVRVGVSLGDQVAGLYAVIGALLGLRQRLTAQTGALGESVDVGLYEAVYSLMESTLPDYDAYGVIPQPSGSDIPGVAPTGTYPCANGKFVVIGGNGDRIFRRLMAAIGRDDLLACDDLATNAGRAARADELNSAVAAWTAGRRIEDVVTSLSAAGVPCGKIYDAADIAGDPQYAARDMFLPAPVTIDGRVRDVAFPGIVPKLANQPGRMRHLGPELGSDTDEVLRGLGYTREQLVELRKSVII